MTSSHNNNNGEALKSGLMVLTVPVILMWVSEIADQLIFHGALDRFGIMPRTTFGLRGILFSPFLHLGFLHLVANTIPFLVLGGFVIIRGIGRFIGVSIVVMILGGLGTWLVGGGGTVHVGASGVVFGYLGFLIGNAIFERSFVAIAIALIAGALYGGILFGLLPGQCGISWEGHLFGFLGGVIAAKIFANGQSEKGKSAVT